jgi:hypothetical protein
MRRATITPAAAASAAIKKKKFAGTIELQNPASQAGHFISGKARGELQFYHQGDRAPVRPATPATRSRPYVVLAETNDDENMTCESQLASPSPACQAATVNTR